MKNIITIIFTFVFFCFPLQAQYIEVKFEVIARFGHYRWGDARLLFDTSVAPQIGTGGTQTYAAISGTYFYHPLFHLGSPGPFAIGEEEADVFESGEVKYFPDSQSLLFDVDAVSPARKITLTIEPMGDEFFNGMESLPDSAEDYATVVDDQNSQRFIGAIGFSNVVIWTPDNGFDTNGSLYYTVRELDELPSYACSPADLNADGEINFFDVSIFIETYLKGCP